MFYVLLAILGLIGTWYFNLQFFQQESEISYVRSWFANSASSSAAVDLIIVAAAFSLFMFIEGLRLRIYWSWVLIPISFLIALAFALPLFLAIREIRLHFLATLTQRNL
jgi:hypothetical protein